MSGSFFGTNDGEAPPHYRPDNRVKVQKRAAKKRTGHFTEKEKSPKKAKWDHLSQKKEERDGPGHAGRGFFPPAKKNDRSWRKGRQFDVQQKGRRRQHPAGSSALSRGSDYLRLKVAATGVGSRTPEITSFLGGNAPQKIPRIKRREASTAKAPKHLLSGKCRTNKSHRLRRRSRPRRRGRDRRERSRRSFGSKTELRLGKESLQLAIGCEENESTSENENK